MGCIDSQTLISVVGENDTIITKKAEDLLVGDIIWAPTYTEYTDESVQSPEEWEAEMLTNMSRIKTTVVSAVPSVKQTLYFNNDSGTRMSFNQLMLLKPSGENWQYLETNQTAIGDYIIKYNPMSDSFEETEITNITIDEGGPRTVYAISVEDTDLFIAGNMLVHNK
jgi:hypothetical protein